MTKNALLSIQDLQVTSSGRENVINAETTSVKEQNEIDQKSGANKETSKKGDKSENKK